MIYDPMMIVLAQPDIIVGETDVSSNVAKLQEFYNDAIYVKEDESEDRIFNGKHQSKEDILRRADALNDFVRSLIK
jgi:hypothetical protein